MTEFRQPTFARPPGATDILLVRHGESAPAKEGVSFDLVGGHGDPELDPRGAAQADRVCDRLARRGGDRAVEAVYVTNLRRTAQTAAPLVAKLGVPVAVEEDLREVFLGDWEGGLFRIKVAQRDPVAVRMMEEERWDVIPGAEADGEFTARVLRGIGRIAGAHRDGTVAVFTHGGVIGRVLAEATGSRPFAFVGAENASISHLVVTDGRLVVRSFNDTAHLEDL